jgi:general secretion pathway protein I
MITRALLQSGVRGRFRARPSPTAGFTLLEVMVAVVILAVGLSSLFASEVGAIRIAQRARTTTLASLLARCKMAEIDEKISKEGWPATNTDGRDECCEGAEHDGFSCEWKLERIVLPDAAQDDGDGAGGGKDGKDGVLGALTGGGSSAKSPAGPSDPLAAAGIPLGGAAGGIDSLLAGKGVGANGTGTGAGGILGAIGAGGGGGGGGDPIASLVMSYAFPVMKPIIEEQVRRATVLVKWKEGSSEQEMDVVQYLVNELPMLPPDSDDDDATNPNVSQAAGGAGTGTGIGIGGSGSGGGTSTSTSGTGANAAPASGKLQ